MRRFPREHLHTLFFSHTIKLLWGVSSPRSASIFRVARKLDTTSIIPCCNLQYIWYPRLPFRDLLWNDSDYICLQFVIHRTRTSAILQPHLQTALNIHRADMYHNGLTQRSCDFVGGIEPSGEEYSRIWWWLVDFLLRLRKLPSVLRARFFQDAPPHE